MFQGMRVFCRKAEAPTPGEILAALTSSSLPAQFDPDADVGPGDAAWEQVIITLTPDGAPLIVDRDLVGPGSIADEEVSEFLAALGHTLKSGPRREIVAHLRQTKQIFTLRVPTSRVDSRGWAVAHAVMRFLVARCDGITQADGEGFYRGNDLVLELP